MAKDRVVLELGIGRGGPHNEVKDPSTLVVGADLRTRNLRECMTLYGISGVAIDASLTPFQDRTKNKTIIPLLPLMASCVDKIELRFPHDGLLYGLTTPTTGLWSEFGRVLKPDGQVQVFFDVPQEGIRQIKLAGHKLEIYKPEQGIWQTAADAGFEVGIKKLNPEQVALLGTRFARTTLRRMRLIEGYTAYELTANKPKRA